MKKVLEYQHNPKKHDHRIVPETGVLWVVTIWLQFG